MNTSQTYEKIAKRSATRKSETAAPAFKDKPGEFAWINKHELQVDESYQRTVKKSKAKAIADNWSWIACGTISVALRESTGAWFIMEGQHRWTAAMLRPDITVLPCMVFGTISIVDEATGFYVGNVNRRPMLAIEKHRALVMMKDHASLVLEELLEKTNRKVSSGDVFRGFTAVGAAKRCIEGNEAAFRRIWPIIDHICGDDHRPDQSIIQGMWNLECHLTNGESLTDKRWLRRIHQVGFNAIKNAMDEAVRYYKGQSPKASGLGIADAINKGLRHHLKHTIDATKNN